MWDARSIFLLMPRAQICSAPKREDHLGWLCFPPLSSSFCAVLAAHAERLFSAAFILGRKDPQQDLCLRSLALVCGAEQAELVSPLCWPWRRLCAGYLWIWSKSKWMARWPLGWLGCLLAGSCIRGWGWFWGSARWNTCPRLC